MIEFFKRRYKNGDAIERFVRKFDLEIINVKKMEITLDGQIKEARRQLAMMKKLYAKKVREGNMKKEDARYHYDCMAAILENLKGQRDGN